MSFIILKTNQCDRWMEVLENSIQYDFYHCPSYHDLSIKNCNAEAILLVYDEGVYTIALPLILKPTSDIPGLEDSGLRDATSVYGYVGPIKSHHDIPISLIGNFQKEMAVFLADHRTVSVFSRLHPLLEQRSLLMNTGDLVLTGKTVSIDLSLTEDEQLSQYRNNHRRGINKLRNLGVTCKMTHSRRHLDEFVDMYHETMNRVGAADFYFFDKEYFTALLDTNGFIIQQFACFLDENMICSGLFSLCNGIIQHHLSATKDEALKLAPTKLLFDEVRIWANQVGAHTFHLGGGLGAREDSLYEFKKGFSKRTHEFYVWRWVVDKNAYGQLCNITFEKGGNSNDDYFPPYRRPFALGGKNGRLVQ